MSDLIKDAVLAGLGLLSLTHEKAEKLAKDLIKKSELSETEEAKFIRDLMKRAEKYRSEAEKKIEKTVEKTFKKLNVPTRKDLDEIKEKLDKLTRK